MAPAALLSASQSRCLSGAACSTTGRGVAAPAAASSSLRRRAGDRVRRAVVAPSPSFARRRPPRHCAAPLLPPRATFFDQAWGTQIDGQSLASQLFSLSLLPYLGFLYHLRKPEARAPPLVLAGFWFLLVFVFATIPAGIYGEGGGWPDFWRGRACVFWREISPRDWTRVHS
jgi:hypothetical protein